MKVTKIFTIVCLLAVSITATYACVGARPFSMGGAFVGVADDANATYWNPAGLAQLKPGVLHFTGMHTASNREYINYQDYASAAMNMGEGGDGSPLAFGLSFISYDLVLGYVDNDIIIDNQKWFWVSAAVNLGTSGMVGVNVRHVNDSLSGVDTDMGLDLGYLYKLNENTTIGVLIQNINEPKTRIKYLGDELSIKNVRNIRPGISFRPDKNSLVTAEIYDLTDELDQALRIGCEYHLPEAAHIFNISDLAFRAGYYGLGSDFSQGLTLGLGVDTSFGKFDLALLTGDFDNTIFFSGSFNLNW